jgi:hypothetical protein
MTPEEIALLAKLRDLSYTDQEAVARLLEALVKARATTAPSNIVKFPIGRIVRERFYRGKDDPERVELDAAAASLRWRRLGSPAPLCAGKIAPVPIAAMLATASIRRSCSASACTACGPTSCGETCRRVQPWCGTK